MSSVTLELDLLKKTGKVDEVKAEDLSRLISQNIGNQFLTINQKFIIDYFGINLELKVLKVDVVDLSQLLNPKSEVKVGKQS